MRYFAICKLTKNLWKMDCKSWKYAKSLLPDIADNGKLLNFVCMQSIIHQLHSNIEAPSLFTYPFCYKPHPLAAEAAVILQHYIADSGIMEAEAAGGGKMFGVLVVRYTDKQGHCRLGFLAAYSGLLAGRNDWPYFVPPVFDAQQPNGHFKTTERKISDINHEIHHLSHNEIYCELQKHHERLLNAMNSHLDTLRQQAAADKASRQQRRQQAAKTGIPLTPDELAAMTRESQYAKAEIVRQRKAWQQRIADHSALIAPYADRIALLMQQRREMSDELQRWLFGEYVVLNALGERRNLNDIFADTTHALPPAGAGDCCAPKLLQYAFANGLQPVCMAEFWWGDSPKNEIRHHLCYYPACRGKCLPILTHMLQGLDVEPDPLMRHTKHSMEIVYEDDALAVVRKPSGMLSVPGKDGRNSVEHIMRQRWKMPADVPIMVHRLDMDTSGLLVVARTNAAYQHLQRQFAARQVCKRYAALLEGQPHCAAEGTISLPLSADIMDRPRQRVDTINGKEAVTRYRIMGTTASGHTLVWLYPHTGRTHQLRVHCAHFQGLGSPILGDPLYGTGMADDRMYLHAAEIDFCHPTTGKQMHFAWDDDALNMPSTATTCSK